ncbi:cellulose binding domain-containing protein [Phytohabitans sp. LJ34]|uniref:cellulose binding domain-containing protein n=1 Tax=Phytohabitans sp. LJ34 TaxID=3452217 RepID=UPI003F8BC150
MRLSTAPLSRIAGLAAAVVVGLGAITVLPAPAHAATATFAKESQWSTGYIGKMTVLNNTGSAITSWRVEFDLPAGTTVWSHWSARLTRSGDRYVFTNEAWNGTLAAGASTSFGWMARGSGEPQGCTVNGAPCSGQPPAADVTPPSAPTNIRVTGSSLLTLTWDPSTDDTGVVGYQIFHRTTQVATTTTPSWTTPVPPPMVTTYGIRAVDAAGNLSPFLPYHFGRLPDTTPPTAPANLRITGTLHQNNLVVRWDPATDETFLTGYEVYLNGALITKTSGTTAYVPYRGFGTYIVRVRAWDSSDNFGPFAQSGIAIDPPPPTTPPVSPPAR